jgi:hypothetical protein
MNYVNNDGEVVDSIRATLADPEVLLHRRREIVKELAPLRALYGGQGHFGERVFKLDEAKVEIAVRTAAELNYATAKQKDEKAKMATEGAIDAALRTRPDYIDALTAAVNKKAKWVELEEEMAEIDWRLRIRGSDSYLLGAEIKLT